MIEHPRAAHYLRPGGPWDGPALDAGLSLCRTTRVVAGDRTLDAGAIDAATGAAAAWLRGEHGVRPGDVVAWQRPNGIDAYLLYRACWRLGAVAAPVHHAAGPADVDAALATASATVFVEGAVPTGDRDPAAPGDPGAGEKPGAVDPAAVAAILFTAGSTGRPKGVQHTHRGLLAKARAMVEVHRLTPQDTVLMPAPMAHISGLLQGVLTPAVAGMTAVFMAKWDPVAAIDLIEEHQVTFMVGPPTFFIGLMEAPGFAPERVASLRLVSSGGSGVTPAFVRSASKALGARVKRSYGCTEAPTVTTSTGDDPEERAAETDGRATGDTELRIHEGEVWIRGPEVFVGYTDEEATRAAFAEDGWFRTGDLGHLDPDGWLTITGRMKDVIIRGGENISATEVEGILEAHPDVTQAVAVGYPDDRLGQRVCAFVVARGRFDLASCRAWMEERGVTRFKWPERVVQVPELPLLAAGKVDRAALTRRAEEVTT